jgi:hypothetical protein
VDLPIEHGDFLRNDDDLLVMMMISEKILFGFLQFLIVSGILWVLDSVRHVLQLPAVRRTVLRSKIKSNIKSSTVP